MLTTFLLLVGDQLARPKSRSVFMTKSEVEVMLMREKEKAYVSSIGLDLKPPYVVEVCQNLIKRDMSLHNSRSFTLEEETLGST